MSASSFWAKKLESIKAVGSPAQIPTELPSNSAEEAKPTNNAVEPDPTAAVASPSTLSKLVDRELSWADDEEDDDESQNCDESVASFNSTEIGSRVGALKEDLIDKKTHVAQLENDAAATLQRIAQLEYSIETKDHQLCLLQSAAVDDMSRISELEKIVAEKDACITEMRIELKLQCTQLEALTGEKDRRIAVLEEKLVNKDTVICRLKMQPSSLKQAFDHKLEDSEVETQTDIAAKLEQSAGTVLEVYSHPEDGQEPFMDRRLEMLAIDMISKRAREEDIAVALLQKAKKDIAEALLQKAKKDIAEALAQKALEKAAEASPQKATKHIAEISLKKTTEAMADGLPEKATDTASEKMKGPTFVDAESPTFLLPATLKVLPAEPAPKKMTFPIDFSKYNKKPDLTSSSADERSKSQGHGKKHNRGKNPRAVRDPNGAPPEFNTLLDIRQMPLAQRLLYGNGPEVSIIMGDIKLGMVPKFVLMQCSTKAYAHFTLHPEATSFVLPAESMDIEAAKLHIKWMDEMTFQVRVYSVTLNTEPKHDGKNLRICRAARTLGLNNTYVGHFTKQLCDRIRSNTVTPDVMDLICTLATPDNDPIFDCLAHNLINRRFRKTYDKGVVAGLEAKHPVLARKKAAVMQRWRIPSRKGGSLESSTRDSSSDGLETTRD